MNKNINNSAIYVEESISVDTTAETVWALIGNFHKLWIDEIPLTKISDDVRKMATPDGGSVTEKLIVIDTNRYMMKYELMHGDLPVTNYISTISAKPDQLNATVCVTWEASFEASGVSSAQAKQIISGLYKMGLQALDAKITMAKST